MFGIDVIAGSMRAALEAKQNAMNAEEQALARLTPFEREHHRLVRDHERQYREKNAPQVTHKHYDRSRYGGGSGDDAFMAGAVGFGLGLMVD